MRKINLYLVICLIYLSCKKEEIVIINPSTTARTIQLKIDQVINDSTIILKWSKFSGNNFKRYRLVRTAPYFKNGQFDSYFEPVDSSNDVNHVTFTENNMPLARDIVYDLYVSKDTTQPNGGFQWVASVYYERPNSLVSGIPRDVLINKPQQKLYILEDNEINIVDYTNGRTVMSKEFSAGIGFCSLGDFNGNTELYVPVNDGWMQILDANTLQLKDRIYVAGYGIGSVVAANEKLYVSSSDKTQGFNCIKVYDRATKNLIGRTGYESQTRLLLLEGTSVEMIDFTPIGLAYYQFSPGGVSLIKMRDSYGYSVDRNIARSFPDGSKFITSSSGAIFYKSLVFDRNVNLYGNCSDFAFNSDGSTIYTAYGYEKKIDVITYPALTLINSYPTTLYPYKIFRDGNTLICVCKTYIHQQMTYLLIEKINL